MVKYPFDSYWLAIWPALFGACRGIEPQITSASLFDFQDAVDYCRVGCIRPESALKFVQRFEFDFSDGVRRILYCFDQSLAYQFPGGLTADAQRLADLTIRRPIFSELQGLELSVVRFDTLRLGFHALLASIIDGILPVAVFHLSSDTAT